ncbi:MAG: methylmalonyl-CoA mutase family protein [Bacteroidota bacterium]
MSNENGVKEEWNTIIAAKLKEGISIEDLKHKYSDKVELEPNVLASDIEEYTHTLTVNHPWINMASIAGGNSSDKNRLILKALNEGANGLSIELTGSDSISEVLENVMTEYLDVRIDCRQLTKRTVEQLKAQIEENCMPNIRWVNQDEDYDQYHIKRENRPHDINVLIDTIGQSSYVDIILTIGKNILYEIATIRAIRSMVEESGFKAFKILVNYDVEGSNELGDYNLIEKTYKVLSAVIGGADAILTPYTGDEDSRLTLNIHNILDLESGMKNVLDPLGGSYYIEKLTGEIVQEVKDFGS